MCSGRDGEGSAHLVHEWGIGRGEGDLHRQVVEGLSALDDRRVDPLVGVLLGVVDGEDDVVGGELDAIVPGDPIPQVEDVDVVALIPGLRPGERTDIILPD